MEPHWADLRSRWFASRGGEEVGVPGSLEEHLLASYCPKVRLDLDPEKGRILRAVEGIEPGEIAIAEGVFVQASDSETREHSEVLGRLRGMWGLVRAISRRSPEEIGLLSQLANAHQARLEQLVDYVEAARSKGLYAWPECSPREVAAFIGRVMTNAFSLSDPQGERWSAVFLLGSLMSHSCAPNTWHVKEQGHLFFHARRAIDAGEELTQSYLPLDTPPEQKRQILREIFGFDCRCSACLEGRGQGE